MTRFKQTVDNDWGPAFEVQVGLSNDVTVWYDLRDDGQFYTGRMLNPDQARELAAALEAAADEVDGPEEVTA